MFNCATDKLEHAKLINHKIKRPTARVECGKFSLATSCLLLDDGYIRWPLTTDLPRIVAAYASRLGATINVDNLPKFYNGLYATDYNQLITQ